MAEFQRFGDQQFLLVATVKSDFQIRNMYNDLDDSQNLHDQVVVNGRTWADWRVQAMDKDFKKSNLWKVLKQEEREIMNRLITAQD